MAGENQLIRHFPFLIGRSRENDLCLDDAGIWERHLKLVFQKKEGFTLETAAELSQSLEQTAHLKNSYDKGIAAGWGDDDFVGLMRLLEKNE